MKGPIMMFLLIGLSGCALFSNRNRSSERSSQQQVSQSDITYEWGRGADLLARKLDASRDSTSESYQIKFWPDTFAVVDKYGKVSGSFDSIIVSGTRQHATKGFSSANLNYKARDSGAVKAHQQQKTVVKQRAVLRKVTPELWTIVVVGLSLLLITSPFIRKFLSKLWSYSL